MLNVIQKWYYNEPVGITPIKYFKWHFSTILCQYSLLKLISVYGGVLSDIAVIVMNWAELRETVIPE